jgi:hypothetical protein
MVAKRDRVPPTGPINGTKLQVSIDHGAVPAQGTLAATATLPLRSARLGDSVCVNPVGALPDGLAIAAARIASADNIEVSLANVTTNPIDPAAILYDVLIRRL